jgi:very-short-patch-repair endonuclease
VGVHRSASVSSHTTIHSNIPVTTVLRTLTDLRRVAPPAEFRDAIRAAEIAGKPVGDFARLTQSTFSELELEFLALCRRHRLPRPEVNARVGRFRVDFLWRAERLIVETDGERFHRGLRAAAEDADRELKLGHLGFLVLRFSHEDVMDTPREVARLVRAHLRHRRPLCVRHSE